MKVETEMTALADACHNLCRVCLTTSQSNQCILPTEHTDSKSEGNYNLIEKFRLCGGVEIMHGDGLPNKICEKCIVKLNDAYELRRQCLNADNKLRILYGKVAVDHVVHKFIPTKDQYCQTDYFYMSKATSTESDLLQELHTSTHINQNTGIKVELKNDFEEDTVPEKRFFEDCDKEDECLGNTASKRKRSITEKPTMIREAYRTRRSTMFKRVTSMESLKNHKERQRKYIKKSTNIKRDTFDNDYGVILKNSQNGIDFTTESNFNCSKCNRCYSSKRSLDRHRLTHNERKFACETCDKEFLQLEKLVCHKKLHKAKEKPEPVQCKICNKTFRKTDTMVRHLNAHKKVNPKEVLSILKEIRDKRKLENSTVHSENIDRPVSNSSEIALKNKKICIQKESAVVSRICRLNPVEDQVCSVDTNSASIKHSPNMHSSRSDIDSNKLDPCTDTSSYKCQHCDKNYTTEKSLQRHVLIHDEKKYVCTVCNMKFFRQDRLKSHKERYGHNETKAITESQKPSDEKSAIKLINTWIREELDSDNEEKGFPCKICGKSYDTKKSLSKHELNVHDTREEACANCGKECICGNESKTQEKSKPYRCDACNKCFEKEIKLQRHLRIHERAKEQQDANFKRFLCHICSKTFRQNTGLMFHMRTHTGYKPHVCKYCGRGFTSNSNCINHERTHTGDRPFVCHFCSAAFAKSCTLKAHITTHTGEANYHCKTCGKSFRRLKYLKEHRFTHTGEKPYACKICGTAYSHSGSLFVHEKKCKAQYNNYQSNATQQNTQQVYCQPPISSATITPIIMALPQTHLSNISGSLNTHTGKTYVDTIQRMNSQIIAPSSDIITPDLQVHQNPADLSEVSSAVRNFALIGQIFQS